MNGTNEPDVADIYEWVGADTVQPSDATNDKTEQDNVDKFLFPPT